MNFVLKIPLKPRWKLDFSQTPGEDWFNDDPNARIYLEEEKMKCHQSTDFSGNRFIIVGDFIVPAGDRDKSDKFIKEFLEDFKPEKLREARGNFYLISVNEAKQNVSVFNSLFSILPVYYHEMRDHIIVSSRLDSILKISRQTFELSKRYILEHLLFGYGFLNDTYFNGIKLLPANHFFEVRDNLLTISSHTRISDFFMAEPLTWKSSVDSLSDLFIERASDYLPDEPYYSSLTGGLDSRTLLALGLSLNKQLTAYSYGSEDDKDVWIPGEICKSLGLNYQPFILDEKYAINDFFHNAKGANYITEGTIRFSRATYMYMADEISKATDYMISGIFGSELMRTTRMYGNLVSHIVFDMFQSMSDLELSKRVRNSPKLRYIISDYFRDEIAEIIQECIEYKNKFKKGLSPNQRFYNFMYEEVFRKYFGSELILENRYLINRTPFLDFKFITELFKTELAGCNGRYMTKSPFERYKGQVLYPTIIKKTYPRLLNYKLDREYYPRNFLSLSGRIRITTGFLLRKTLLDKKRYRQPGYNYQAIKININKISKINYNFPFINNNEFSLLFDNERWKRDHINFNIYISLLDYLDQVKQIHRNVKF